MFVLGGVIQQLYVLNVDIFHVWWTRPVSFFFFAENSKKGSDESGDEAAEDWQTDERGYTPED